MHSIRYYYINFLIIFDTPTIYRKNWKTLDKNVLKGANPPGPLIFPPLSNLQYKTGSKDDFRICNEAKAISLWQQHS